MNLRPFDNPPVLNCGAFTMGGCSENFEGEALFLKMATDDPEVLKFMPSMRMADPDAARRFIEKSTMAMFSKTMIPVFIKLAGTSATIGWIFCWSPKANTGLGEWTIEFLLTKMMRGRGYMTVALNNLLATLESSGVETVKAIVDPANKASIDILQKLSFERMGQVKSKDGKSLHDLYSVKLN